jgi:hypothetical protein
MDPLFMACSLFRRRKFDECVKICSQMLEKNPYDQVKTNRFLSFNKKELIFSSTSTNARTNTLAHGNIFSKILSFNKIINK